VGKLEEHRKYRCFEEIEKILTNLARFAKADKVRREWYDYNRLYRILSDPLEEINRWEEEGGYDPEKSMWHRYVCTANRYLGCMMKIGLNPPWLRKPQVMIEIQKLYPDCVKYSDAAVGNVPTIRGKRSEDIYVNQEDLPLLECWIDRKVGIGEIKKIYLDKEADEKVKKRVREFAEKHEIPIENKIPCPSDDEKVMREYERPSDYGVTDEGLKKSIDFLRQRSEQCWIYMHRPPSDSVVAALAESLDEAFHHEWPLGASDAISKKNERLRQKPPWGVSPPEPECDAVICKRGFEETLQKIQNGL